MELDDDVPSILVVGEPTLKHRQLSRTQGPLVVGSIKRLIELYGIGWFLCLFASEPLFEINQDFSPISLHNIRTD